MSDWEEDEDSANVLPLSAYFPGNKSGGQRTVDYYEDDDYVRDTSSNGHHIKSRVFRNKNVDRPFNNETGSSRFGRSDQPFVDDTRQPSESSLGGRFGRRSQPFVESDKFSDDVVLKINSGDVGRIIGRQGSKIKEMEQNSGARIKVIKSPGAVTTVKLIGSSEAQQKAKQFIESTVQLINDVEHIDRGVERMGFSKLNAFDDYDAKPTRRINWSALNSSRAADEVEKWAGLPEVKKHFYIEDPAVSKMTADEVQQIRTANNNITVFDLSGEDRPIPNPVRTFEEAFRPYPDILKAISNAGFEKPSPIQSQAWPIALQGHDMIGIAQTGTGKTLAFLLPAVIHIDGQITPRHQRGGPTVLVLSPTRELALQIETEVNKYPYMNMKRLFY